MYRVTTGWRETIAIGAVWIPEAIELIALLWYPFLVAGILAVGAFPAWAAVVVRAEISTRHAFRLCVVEVLSKLLKTCYSVVVVVG